MAKLFGRDVLNNVQDSSSDSRYNGNDTINPKFQIAHRNKFYGLKTNQRYIVL